MRQMCSFTCFLIKVASSFYFDCTFLLLNYWKTLRVHWCTLIKLSPVGIVLFRPSVMSNFLQPHGMQHPRLSCPSPSPRVCSYSCPLSRWCHPTISPSVVLFSSCPQSLPASGSFPASWLFACSGQSVGASVLASVLPMNIQDWFPLGLPGLMLQLQGLSRVFSNTTVQKHQFFSAQLSFWSNSQTSILGKAIALTT